MECNATLRSDTERKKCKKCGMDLCKNCYKKHNMVCIWCFNGASDESLWAMKFTGNLLKLTPLLAFLVPMPYPLIITLFTNYRAWGLVFLFMAILFVIFGIAYGAAHKKFVDSIVIMDHIPDESEKQESLDFTTTMESSITKDRTESKPTNNDVLTAKRKASSVSYTDMDAEPTSNMPSTPSLEKPSKSESSPAAALFKPQAQIEPEGGNIPEITQEELSFAPVEKKANENTEKIICPGCGYMLMPGVDFFCPNCGNKV